MNTILPTGEAPSEGFSKWRKFCRENPEMPIAQLLYAAMFSYNDEEVAAFKDKVQFESFFDPNPIGTPILSMEEAMAYEAPFVDSQYKAFMPQFLFAKIVKKLYIVLRAYVQK